MIAKAQSIAASSPALLFGTLMLGLMSQGLALTASVSALPEIARELGGGGEFIAQMTQALVALGLMLGALASGWIFEKAGTRTTLMSSLVVFGMTGAGGMFLQEPWLLLAGRFGVGFASACVVTTCLWGIGTEYEGDRRARAFGVAGALSSVAGLVGVTCGGYLAQRGGWRLASLQYPIFALAGLIVAFAGIRQVLPEHSGGDEERRSYFKQLLPLYVLVVLLFAVFSMGGTQFPFLLEELGLHDPAQRSLVLGVPTIAGIMSSLAYGPVQKLLNSRSTFSLGLACMAAGLASIGFGNAPTFAVLGASLMGLSIGLIGPYLYHSVAERTDAYSRGHHIGLLNAFTFFGIFLNPIIFEPMANAIGLRRVFLVGALVVTVLALFTMRSLLGRCGEVRENAHSSLI